MAPNPRRIAARMQAVYDKLPAVPCQGFCHDSCGPIDATPFERDRMERAAGRKLTCGVGASCSMLTEDRKCSVYELRPLICRAWGAVEGLPCHYGCRPEGGPMPDREFYELILESQVIGGPHDPGRTLSELLSAMEELRAAPDHVVSAVRRATTPRPSLKGRIVGHNIPPTIFEKGVRDEPVRGQDDDGARPR